MFPDLFYLAQGFGFSHMLRGAQARALNMDILYWLVVFFSLVEYYNDRNDKGFFDVYCGINIFQFYRQ